MFKSILKEICIILLLCIAIVLVLGVIFYDYIPTNKAIPNKLSAYVTPQDVKTEINEQITEINKVEVSYEITGTDINLYKQTHSYTPGKVDPFSASNNIENIENVENVENNGQTSNTDPNSTGTFFNNTGLK